MNVSLTVSFGEICSLCSHLFGEHWESFDGKKVGCSNKDDRGDRCSCQGYAITYRTKMINRAVEYDHSKDYIRE